MFALKEQARALLAALSAVEGLESADYLDDEAQSAAAPARMPAAWLIMERVAVETPMAGVTWAVLLKSKRLRGLDGACGALDLVERVIGALHGRKLPVPGAKPPTFVEAEYMDGQWEAAVYVIRFRTEQFVGRALGPCPNP